VLHVLLPGFLDAFSVGPKVNHKVVVTEAEEGGLRGLLLLAQLALLWASRVFCTLLHHVSHDLHQGCQLSSPFRPHTHFFFSQDVSVLEIVQADFGGQVLLENGAEVAANNKQQHYKHRKSLQSEGSYKFSIWARSEKEEEEEGDVQKRKVMFLQVAPPERRKEKKPLFFLLLSSSSFFWSAS